MISENYRYQLHVGKSLPPGEVYLYGYSGWHDPSWNKPQAAFWTSTAIKGRYYQSAWTHYCLIGGGEKRWIDRETYFLIDTGENAHRYSDIYHITDAASFVSLEKKYYTPVKAYKTAHNIDWMAMSHEWAAVHVTDEALKDPDLQDVLLGWDLESTAWFRLPNYKAKRVRRTFILD